MKLAFVDVEFTGEHARTTLVSLGIAGLGDERLNVTFNDYAEEQVTPWLRENVLEMIDPAGSVSQPEGLEIVRDWFESYREGERVSLVSAGKMLDLILLFELWAHAFPEREWFHHLHCLPDYLNHAAHFDLPTVFFLSGVDPNVDREEFAGAGIEGVRHEALYDALVVRECFKKCLASGAFPRAALDGPLPA